MKMESFDIRNPTYSNVMRKLTTSDPGHADTFNPLFQQLLENDEVLKDIIDTHTKEENPHGLTEITAEEIFAMYGGDVEVGGIGDAEIGIGKASIDEMYENNLTYSTDTGIPNEEIDEMY